MGDANRLHQVISNLLTNALKHAGEDANVKISLLKTSPELVTIDVQDDGEGIPADALPHLFERFYRPDGSRSRASGGSGLGLSIVQSLVKAHGGAITVDSTLGEGTTFRGQLPVAPEASPAQISPDDFLWGCGEGYCAPPVAAGRSLAPARDAMGPGAGGYRRSVRPRPRGRPR